MNHPVLIPIRSYAELQWWIASGPFFGFRGRFAVSFRNDRDEALTFDEAKSGPLDGVPVTAVTLTPCVFGDEVNRTMESEAAKLRASGFGRFLDLPEIVAWMHLHRDRPDWLRGRVWDMASSEAESVTA